MNLVNLATHNLKRRPIRTSLSILGIGLAVGGALALISLSHSIQDSAREGMDEMGDDLVVMQKGASDVFGGFIPEQTVELVAATPGVTRVSGEMALFAPSGTKAVLTLGWPDGSYLWQKVPLREGRAPNFGERHVVVLGDRWTGKQIAAEAMRRGVKRSSKRRRTLRRSSAATRTEAMRA
jgi:putative ABC transport system permease protein